MIRHALHRIALPVAIALTLSLSACASTSDNGISAPAPPPVVDPAPVPPPSASVSPPMAGTMQCNDGKGQTAVGQTATQAVVDKIIADTGSRNARVIKPGQAVTMDYREDRVNINVDANNVIISVKCG